MKRILHVLLLCVLPLWGFPGAAFPETRTVSWTPAASYTDGTPIEPSKTVTSTVYWSPDPSLAASSLRTIVQGSTQSSFAFDPDREGMPRGQTVYFTAKTVLGTGEESALSPAYPWTVPPAGGTVSLSFLSVSGPATLNEGGSATYTATATYSDGSSKAVTPAWSENSPFATISASGVLSAQSVTSNQTVTVSASYTEGSVTRTASQSVAIVDVAATLAGLAIGSPTSVPENSTATYTATASWSDGTTSDATSGSVWSVSPGTYAAIGGGVLTTSSVPSDQSVTVSASYTAGGVTKTASLAVTILDTAPPAEDPVVSEVPAPGTVDAPVNTVVTATVAPGENVEAIFNAETFTLRRTSLAAATASSGSAPDRKCADGDLIKGRISYDEARTAGIFTPACLLENGTAYLATIAPAAGGLSEPVSWEFTTIGGSPDTDDDGVPDNEDDYPTDNRKGTPPSTRGNGKFLIEVPGDDGALSDVDSIDETDDSLNQAGNPSGFEFRDGLVSYTVTGVAPGSTVTVKVTVPGGIPKGSLVYKADATGFHEYPGAVINGSTVTLTLTDGGAGDADGTADGRIVDPVGVASPVASGSGSIDLSTGSSAGGGCTAAPAAGRGSAGTASLLVLALLGLVLRAFRRPGRRG